MSLFYDYLQLCWFKNNPTDFNPPQAFLGNFIGFYLVSGIIVEANISDPADATLEVGMRALVALMLLVIMAFVNKQWILFKPLLVAVFMCENVIIALGIGVEFLDDRLQHTKYEDYPLILGGLLILWYLTIIAYIFNKMFSFHRYHSMGLAVFYFLMTYGLPFLVMEVL
jgi:hypothetical protein